MHTIFTHAVFHTVTKECLLVGTFELCSSFRQINYGLCAFVVCIAEDDLADSFLSL